jgi:hypothetical protein
MNPMFSRDAQGGSATEAERFITASSPKQI